MWPEQMKLAPLETEDFIQGSHRNRVEIPQTLPDAQRPVIFLVVPRHAAFLWLYIE